VVFALLRYSPSSVSSTLTCSWRIFRSGARARANSLDMIDDQGYVFGLYNKSRVARAMQCT
jgi:hypothetical protein